MMAASWLKSFGEYQASENLLHAYMRSDRALFEETIGYLNGFLNPDDLETEFYLDVLNNQIRLPIVYRQLTLF